MQPNNTDAYNNLGIALVSLGHRDKAVECFQSAIRFEPSFTEAYNNLGFTLNREPDNARAADYVYVEWRKEKGICFTPSSRLQQFSAATVSSFLMNPDNHWGSSRPIAPRVQSATAPNECDAAVGITIPYFTPKSVSVRISSLNITDANRDGLFTDANWNRDAPASTATSRGWVGYLTRVPAASDEYGDIVAQLRPETRYEFAYIRPSNGLAVPGAFSADPYTTVQYGATFYEWFVLRSRAFLPVMTSDGKTVNRPVFEAKASTRFPGTDLAAMVAEANVLELDFDSGPSQVLRVNGQNIVSNVSGAAMDRTLLNSVTPNSDAQTMNVLFTEAGIYACVQSITMTF